MTRRTLVVVVAGGLAIYLACLVAQAIFIARGWM